MDNVTSKGLNVLFSTDYSNSTKTKHMLYSWCLTMINIYCQLIIYNRLIGITYRFQASIKHKIMLHAMYNELLFHSNKIVLRALFHC